ncbi:hypothetical protein EXN66_Car020105 [Channa argus]|uniref:Uncharacterized protein n=1 Tax=Channa argus TaxID=215402 RepID=A0A6G1QQQ8_CHAAH|nr:hypothetical protein EXN66_Car020105 [Channa argus]
MYFSFFLLLSAWQLALVIAGSLLSGLLLISLIILPIVSIKSKKTFINDNAEIGNPYTNFTARAQLGIGTLANSQAQSINGSSLTSPRVHKIPRARTTSWTNQDMSGIYSQQNLIYANRNSRVFDNQDDIQSRSETGDYGRARIQSQPQIKPYAENQSPINTYGQRRGQINPFFRHNENN